MRRLARTDLDRSAPPVMPSSPWPAERAAYEAWSGSMRGGRATASTLAQPGKVEGSCDGCSDALPCPSCGGASPVSAKALTAIKWSAFQNTQAAASPFWQAAAMHGAYMRATDRSMLHTARPAIVPLAGQGRPAYAFMLQPNSSIRSATAAEAVVRPLNAPPGALGHEDPGREPEGGGGYYGPDGAPLFTDPMSPPSRSGGTTCPPGFEEVWWQKPGAGGGGGHWICSKPPPCPPDWPATWMGDHWVCPILKSPLWEPDPPPSLSVCCCPVAITIEGGAADGSYQLENRPGNPRHCFGHNFNVKIECEWLSHPVFLPCTIQWEENDSSSRTSGWVDKYAQAKAEAPQGRGKSRQLDSPTLRDWWSRMDPKAFPDAGTTDHTPELEAAAKAGLTDEVTMNDGPCADCASGAEENRVVRRLDGHIVVTAGCPASKCPNPSVEAFWFQEVTLDCTDPDHPALLTKNWGQWPPFKASTANPENDLRDPWTINVGLWEANARMIRVREIGWKRGFRFGR